MSAAANSTTHDESSRRHRWPALHIAGRALALAMRLLPRRRRFRAAIRVSTLIRWIVERSELHREERSESFDTVAEVALYHVLRTMTEHGTEFDLDVVLEGLDVPAIAAMSGSGVIIVSPHAMLGTVAPRLLYDHDVVPTVVALHPGFRLLGTRVPARAVYPSRSFLVGIRRTLRSGGAVCAMIDQPLDQDHLPRIHDFPTDRGCVRVSDALLRLATACGAAIVFGCVRLKAGRVVLAFGTPSPSAIGDAESIAREFSAFVVKHAPTVPRRGGENSAVRTFASAERAWHPTVTNSLMSGSSGPADVKRQ